MANANLLTANVTRASAPKDFSGTGVKLQVSRRSKNTLAEFLPFIAHIFHTSRRTPRDRANRENGSLFAEDDSRAVGG